MIKLEDLKIGDIIYHTYKYQWIIKAKIIKEVQYFDGISEMAYIESRDTDNLHLHDIKRSNERELFKTYEEALQYQNNCKQKRINYLLNDDNLTEDLYGELCRTGVLTSADREIYEIVIDKRNKKQTSKQ